MANWSDMFQALREAEIPVYLPGGHRGICKKPYVVIQPLGTQPDAGGKTGREEYGVTAYVPVEQLGGLTAMIGQIQQALLPVSGSFRATGKISSLTLDETFRAAKATVYYEMMKKLQ
ncbi:MAG: hypothetical protein HFE85_00220 [Clostridiales bacterium]|nr:hypothetical protein [Clostridiales bacterium]